MVVNVFLTELDSSAVVRLHSLAIVAKHQVSSESCSSSSILLFLLRLAANPCQPSPCQNGGLCQVQGTTFLCQCPATFIGRCCEIRVTTTTPFNPCAQATCQNGGRCVPTGTCWLLLLVLLINFRVFLA